MLLERRCRASSRNQAAEARAQNPTLPKVSCSDAPPLPAHACLTHRRAVPGFSTAGLAMRFLPLVDDVYAAPAVITLLR
jgi:hypothetical protein